MPFKAPRKAVRALFREAATPTIKGPVRAPKKGDRRINNVRIDLGAGINNKENRPSAGINNVQIQMPEDIPLLMLSLLNQNIPLTNAEPCPVHASPRRRATNGTSALKAHVGVDASSGLVHTAGVTSGNVHDAKVMDRLVRDDDTAVNGDKGYASDAKKRAAEATGVLWAVKEKAKPGGRREGDGPFGPR